MNHINTRLVKNVISKAKDLPKVIWAPKELVREVIGSPWILPESDASCFAWA
jgi:hypothetical protein